MALADLAREVRAARTRFTLEEIHEAGGPSPNTVGQISRFDPSEQKPWPVRPATLRALDVGCRWDPDTAQRLYDRDGDPPGLYVHDATELAEAVADRVLAKLVERLTAAS